MAEAVACAASRNQMLKLHVSASDLYADANAPLLSPLHCDHVLEALRSSLIRDATAAATSASTSTAEAEVASPSPDDARALNFDRVMSQVLHAPPHLRAISAFSAVASTSPALARQSLLHAIGRGVCLRAPDVVHGGIVCAVCRVEDIRGVRFKCTVCAEDMVNRPRVSRTHPFISPVIFFALSMLM